MAATTRYAVVTGANKGLGLEICRQLATNGITVVLTARDRKRGLEALEKLKESGLSSDLLVFHQLDVANPSTIAPLADFVKTRFGRLDILVNNAGITGAIVDADAMKALAAKATGEGIQIGDITTESYELGVECFETNYYGAKRMVDAFIPLLQFSDSPRIVNVSSSMGKLQLIANEWAKGVLNHAESLTEEKVEQVVNQFLKDFKEGSVAAKGWPTSMSAYIVSKAAVNAYTRVVAKKYPTFVVNCVCPGFVKTDMNFNTGVLSVEEGAGRSVKLALLPSGGPTGQFFANNEVSTF